MNTLLYRLLVGGDLTTKIKGYIDLGATLNMSIKKLQLVEYSEISRVIRNRFHAAMTLGSLRHYFVKSSKHFQQIDI